jgi:tRNA dimethylallyltransferase
VPELSAKTSSTPTAASRLGPLVVIGGPTATGKTALAVRLAIELGDTEIVSADSRQVYKGMDIGTAKPSPAERHAVPHHGIDLIEPDERFSVSAYHRHATEALEAIHERGHRALLVGGTGLYLRAVARGLDVEDAPSDPELRAELEREQVRAGGVEAQVERLQRLAPQLAARTDLRNPRRVVRALEVATLAGDRLPGPPRGYPAPVLWLLLRLPRDVHLDRIERRVAGQFAGGLLEEAKRLQKRYPRNAAAFTAFGYWEAFAVLDEAMSREDAIRETIDRTRAYAKRQMTWFRAEDGGHWIDASDDPLPEAMALVSDFFTASAGTSAGTSEGTGEAAPAGTVR